MKIAEFKEHASERIEASIRKAEVDLGKTLPRTLAFRWLSPQGPTVTAAIEEEVARLAFVDDEHIYPCVDIGPLELDGDGRLVIGALRAGFAPRPFGLNLKGEPGPFILIFFEQIRAAVA